MVCQITVIVHGFWVHLKPACHAGPENKWKEQLIGTVYDTVEEKDGS